MTEGLFDLLGLGLGLGVPQVVGSFTADAILQRTRSGSVTADAVVVKAQPESITASDRKSVV